jgi:hypothetical protein
MTTPTVVHRNSKMKVLRGVSARRSKRRRLLVVLFRYTSLYRQDVKQSRNDWRTAVRWLSPLHVDYGFLIFLAEK